MEDFNFNTSQNGSYTNDFNYTKGYFTYSRITNSCDYHDHYEKAEFIKHVATCIIIIIGLPLILVAIYSLYSLVRKDNVAPIYVINLLISDLIQLCCMIVMEALPRYCEMTDEERLIYGIFFYIHLCCVVVSVGLMVCIALERYLVIVYPLWYRFRRTIKSSVVVCVLVWVVPLVLLMIYSWHRSVVHIYIYVILLLLPLPLFIFFLGGTLKALSASISVSSEEKRRIVGILVLVLLIYTLLFLPFIILLCSLLSTSSDIQTILFYLSFADADSLCRSLTDLSLMLLKLSPLADLVLYIFMRKGAIDKLLTSLCRCRMDNNDVISLDTNDEMDSNDVTRPIV